MEEIWQVYKLQKKNLSSFKLILKSHIKNRENYQSLAKVIQVLCKFIEVYTLKQTLIIAKNRKNN